MKKSVAVLGLGKFGSSIARSLAKGGAEVLAVDKDEDLVRDIADKVTCAVCVDISDKEMMNNICLLYTSPSPRDGATSRMPSSA